MQRKDKSVKKLLRNVIDFFKVSNHVTFTRQTIAFSLKNTTKY